MGLDVHKDFCQATVLEEDRTLIKEGRMPTSREALEAFFWPLGRTKVAMEVVGFSEWIYDHLEAMRLEVILAHPYGVKAIAEARVKTDKVDARTLTHLLRVDLLPRSYVPQPEIRRVRALVGEWVHVTRTMTRMNSRIRSELYRREMRPPAEALFGVHGRASLASLGMEAVDLIDSAVKDGSNNAGYARPAYPKPAAVMFVKLTY